jgi:hypothetical protein
MNRLKNGGSFVLRDAAALPVLLIGIFMLVAMGTQSDLPSPEDRLFAGIGGDYRVTSFGVHGTAGVYPLRIKYFDHPDYHGPPVILVHGMGTSDAYFWRVRGEVEVFAGFIYSEQRDISAVGHAQGLVDLGYDVVTYTYPRHKVDQGEVHQGQGHPGGPQHRRPYLPLLRGVGPAGPHELPVPP